METPLTEDLVKEKMDIDAEILSLKASIAELKKQKAEELRIEEELKRQKALITEGLRGIDKLNAGLSEGLRDMEELQRQNAGLFEGLRDMEEFKRLEVVLSEGSRDIEKLQRLISDLPEGSQDSEGLKKQNAMLSEGIQNMKKLNADMTRALKKFKSRMRILLTSQFVTKDDKVLSSCRIDAALSNQERDGEKGPASTEAEQQAFLLKQGKPSAGGSGKGNRGSRSDRKRREPEHVIDHTGKLSDLFKVKTVVVDSQATVDALLKRAEEGDEAVRIGEDCVEVLECERTTCFYCKRYILGKFAIKGKPELGVAVVPAPPRMLPKTKCGDSFLSVFIGDKFDCHLAYRSQEAMWNAAGLYLPMQLLCDWQLKATDKIMPLYRLLGKRLNEGDVLQMDETPVSIDDCVKAKPYVWIKVVGDGARPGCQYMLAPGRDKAVPLEMTEGFKGYLQLNAYNCSMSLGKDNVGIVLVPSVAHMRRKMVDVMNLYGEHLKSANDIIILFDRLFDIERNCYAAYEKHKSKERFLSERKDLSLPVISEIKAFLERKPVLDNEKAVDGPTYDEAVNYCKALVDHLPRYLDKFELTPGSNVSERSNIRLKEDLDAWLKFGSDRGCVSACVIFSLLRSAELNKLDPVDYLNHVFTHAPKIFAQQGYDEENIELWEDLLPWNVDKKELEAQEITSES